jgi:hypothetical protein
VRPGEMPARIVLSVSLSETWAGVPVGLQAVVGVEAAHAIERVEGSSALCATLDLACDATKARPPVVPAPRLCGYAAQLERSCPCTRPFAGTIELLPPSRLMATWKLAAWKAGSTVEEWISTMLARAPRRALLWEAAAAVECMTLTEWVLLQALSA